MTPRDVLAPSCARSWGAAPGAWSYVADDTEVESGPPSELLATQVAYEDAGIRGLCADGRWEEALAAICHLDLFGVLEPPADSAHVDESA